MSNAADGSKPGIVVLAALRRRTWIPFAARLAGVAAAVLLVSACAGYSVGQNARPATEGRIAQLIVSDVRIFAPPERTYRTGGVAKAGLRLHNAGNTRDELTGASSPQARTVALLHYSEPQPQVPIDPGQTEALLLQLQDLQGPVSSGQTVQIVLQFRTAGSLPLDVPVQNAQPS